MDFIGKGIPRDCKNLLAMCRHYEGEFFQKFNHHLSVDAYKFFLKEFNKKVDIVKERDKKLDEFASVLETFYYVMSSHPKTYVRCRPPFESIYTEYLKSYTTICRAGASETEADNEEDIIFDFDDRFTSEKERHCGANFQTQRNVVREQCRHWLVSFVNVEEIYPSEDDLVYNLQDKLIEKDVPLPPVTCEEVFTPLFTEDDASCKKRKRDVVPMVREVRTRYIRKCESCRSVKASAWYDKDGVFLSTVASQKTTVYCDNCIFMVK